MGVLVLPAAAQYGGGAGTSDNPYLIFTAQQFRALASNPGDWDLHFRLMADLDLSSYGSAIPLMIGTSDDGAFTGTFDGNHKTISGFRRSSDSGSYLGLFGMVEGSRAHIRNVILRDPRVVSETGRYLGALVGWLREGTIENCHVRGGTVQADSFVGGLVGRTEGGRVSDCTAEASVHGVSRVGGLIGESYFGTIERCRTAGETWGPLSSIWIAGLIGSSRNATVKECRACCIVQGDLYVGGLIGENLTATIDRCCTAGSVEGLDAVGGLVGQNSGGTVSDSYATAGVVGVTHVGGLAGCNGPSCQCAVYTPGVIERCYASGPVQGNSPGGLIGASGRSETHQSFWDIETTGCTQSAGGDGGTTKDLGSLTTYLAVGWDFVGETRNGAKDIWCLPAGGGYPRLTWELGVSDLHADGRIDLRDFGRFAIWWRRADTGLWSGDACAAADGRVNAEDLKDLVQFWLAGRR